MRIKITGKLKKYNNVRFHVLDGVTDELREYDITAKWDSIYNRYRYTHNNVKEGKDNEVFNGIVDIENFMTKDGKFVYIKPFEEDLKD